jgi:hypothetical protein
MRIKLTIFMLMMTVGKVYADSSSLNLNIPSSPQSYQSDRIRADNVECSMAIGSSTNVEFGVVGIINQNDPFNNMNGNSMDSSLYNNNNDLVKDVGVYAKITIPIGAPKERLNCNTLYQLELEKKRLEVMKLKQEIQNLRTLKFENDG